MNRLNRLRATTAAAASALFSTAAQAGGGGGGHSEPHVANWFGIGEQYASTPAVGWMFVTFAIFLGLLVKFGKKPLADHLQNRSDTVKNAIEEATRAKEQAEARAREAEAKLAALDAEVSRMKADFQAQGKVESARIEAAAKEMAAKIARDADATIAAEVDRAREALRVEAARLALQLAEERIVEGLTPADDARLKKSLLDTLAA
jgi:F-type H+-transporting ATPase subunit b